MMKTTNMTHFVFISMFIAIWFRFIHLY